jgi:hypothetical protein
MQGDFRFCDIRGAVGMGHAHATKANGFYFKGTDFTGLHYYLCIGSGL